MRGSGVCCPGVRVGRAGSEKPTSETLCGKSWVVVVVMIVAKAVVLVTGRRHLLNSNRLGYQAESLIDRG